MEPWAAKAECANLTTQNQNVQLCTGGLWGDEGGGKKKLTRVISSGANLKKKKEGLARWCSS